MGLKRKLPDSYKEQPFIEGYLTTRLESGDLPNYIYKYKSLPKTSGKIRKIISSFNNE